MDQSQTIIRVGTLNIHGTANRWRQRRHLIVTQLLEADLDLISLQELNPFAWQGSWLKNKLNQSLPADKQYRWFMARHRSPFSSLGILSRLPVTSSDTATLGQGRQALRLHIELPSRQTIDFTAVHLHQHRLQPEVRKEQAMRLLGWLKSRGGERRQIIAGDFCDLPQSVAIQQMKQQYRSAYALFHGHEPAATFPTNMVSDIAEAACLDYLFIAPETGRVTGAEIICRKAHPYQQNLYPSDHVGVMASIEIGENS